MFCLLDPEKFQIYFTRWVKSAFPEMLSLSSKQDNIISIDGKMIRGSRSKGKRAVHMVSAWSSKLSMVLGQKKVTKKSNAITAIPELLEAINLRGALITADAISCQKSIAETCVQQETAYLLAVKGNQKTLQKDIQSAIEAHWEKKPKYKLSDIFAEQINSRHGRKEYR